MAGQFITAIIIGLLGFILIRYLLGRQSHAEQKRTLERLSAAVARIDESLGELTRRVARLDARVSLLAPAAETAPALETLTVAAEIPAAPAVAAEPVAEAEAEELPPQFVPATMLASQEAPAEAAERAEMAEPAETPMPWAPAKPVAPAGPSSLQTLGSTLAAGLGRYAGLEQGEKVSWEAIVGGRWLNLIGMLVLVVGIALLSQQALVRLPPLGKIAFGAGLGIAMVVGGILLERSKTYVWIGRTLIGGGWAILYFTAYAAYNVAQAKIIDSPTLALLALAAVAAGMLVHSLRYRNQVVTGLASAWPFLPSCSPR